MTSGAGRVGTTMLAETDTEGPRKNGGGAMRPFLIALIPDSVTRYLQAQAPLVHAGRRNSERLMVWEMAPGA